MTLGPDQSKVRHELVHRIQEELVDRVAVHVLIDVHRRTIQESIENSQWIMELRN